MKVDITKVSPSIAQLQMKCGFFGTPKKEITKEKQAELTQHINDLRVCVCDCVLEMLQNVDVIVCDCVLEMLENVAVWLCDCV